MLLSLVAIGAPMAPQGTLKAQDSTPVITCNPEDPEDCTCDGVPIGHSTYTEPAWLDTGIKSIYETSALMYGKSTPLSNYRAPATLVTNVASA